MKRGLVRVCGMLAALALTATASAQFGHPLKGTWLGEWGPSKDKQSRIVMSLNWDGKAVTGTINPGPNAVQLQKAELDPSNWGVRFEAEGKDQSGKPVRYLIQGKLENIGAYERFMTGTWTQGDAKGEFKLTRQ